MAEEKKCTTLDRAQKEKDIIERIKTVYDPEIPVNIWELGLIYKVTVNEDYSAHVLMTLTAPNCPAAEILPLDVEDAAMSVPGITKCDVEITFDPTWTKELMSDAAKLELGML